MKIENRYALASCSIEEPYKTINVRSRIEQWVVQGAEEVRLDTVGGLHRISLSPGDWAGADQWGVRAYADVAWTPEVVDAWGKRPQAARPDVESVKPVGA